MVLNKEIQSQQRLDSLAEASGLASPRQPRKALVSSESYLQRLSMASRSSLWQEIPVVRNSTVLLSMTHEDQKLQEVPGKAVVKGQGAAGRGEGGKASHLSHPHPLLSSTTTSTHPCVPSQRDLGLLPEGHHCPASPLPGATGRRLLPVTGADSHQGARPLNLVGGAVWN